MQRTYGKVTFRREGWHRWPDATPERDYLSNSHRHLFHVTVLIELTHNEREVEFHNLLDNAKAMFATDILEHGAHTSPRSCEQMASELCISLSAHYGGRYIRVEVMEDGENGAIVEHFPTITPEPPQ